MFKLLIAGYKDVSLVDVYGHVTFTLWMCGCNFKCPFCHNWRIAVCDRNICYLASIDEIINSLKYSKKLIDYLHVTGGEPLIQFNGLTKLFEKTIEEGIDVSLNTNLSYPRRLEKLLSRNLVSHIASDLKIPFKELTGLGDKAFDYWTKYLESLEIIGSYDVVFELRIIVAHNLTLEYLEGVLNVLKPLLKKIRRIYCIINPLVGPPLVEVRDPMWCKRYCNPGNEELDRVKSIVEKILDVKTIIRKWRI